MRWCLEGMFGERTEYNGVWEMGAGESAECDGVRKEGTIVRKVLVGVCEQVAGEGRGFVGVWKQGIGERTECCGVC